MKSHMKEFWKYSKSLRKTNSYPSTMEYSIPGSGAFSASDSSGIASLFACYFTSVFQLCLQPFVSNPSKTVTTLETIQLNEDDILQAIKQLDPDKGPGVDTIPSYFVKKCRPSTGSTATFDFQRFFGFWYFLVPVQVNDPTSNSQVRTWPK